MGRIGKIMKMEKIEKSRKIEKMWEQAEAKLGQAQAQLEFG